MKTFERRRAYNDEIKWSKDEESRLLSRLKKSGYDKDILQRMFPNRSLASIRSKTRKLRIKYDLFGASYRQAKSDFTEKHAKRIKPKTVFEGYCGAGHQSEVWIAHAETVYASDKSIIKRNQFKKNFKAKGFEMKESDSWRLFSKQDKRVLFFHGDIVDAAVELRAREIKVDVLDLDTCGSTLPLLPTLLTLIRPRFLAITHGEFHSRRFGRDDVLRRLLVHRNIDQTNLHLTPDELADELNKAVKMAALRAHNETHHSYWLELEDETWLGSKFHGMLRRLYRVKRPAATADCLNELLG